MSVLFASVSRDGGPIELGGAAEAAQGDLRIAVDARLDDRDGLVRALDAPREATDAELILRAVERWDVDAASRLLGDFAFIAWDGARRRLLAARDAMGARGLCYAADARRILLASSIARLVARADVPVRPHHGKIAASLLDRWDDQETSLFEGIRYLPPGCLLLVDDGRLEIRRYWNLEPGARVRLARDADYAEHFREVAARAVSDRMRPSLAAGGPVGVSLSGGLDSSTVAALAARELETLHGRAPGGRTPGDRLRAYSYVFDSPLEACDERVLIQATASRYGLPTTFVDGGALGPLGDPLGDSKDGGGRPTVPGFLINDPYAPLALSIVEAAAADGCRTLLTGHFGDVLFLGGAYWAADLFVPRRWVDLARLLRARWRWLAPRRDLLSHGLLQWIPGSRWTRWRSARPPIAEALGPALRPSLEMDLVSGDDRSWREHRVPGQWSRARSLLSAAGPQGAMAVRDLFARRGIERLDPLADRRLVELAFALPADQLGLPGETRPVLRRAMKDLLPESVRRRPDKTHFSPWLERGMRRDGPRIRALLEAPRVVERGFLRGPWLRRQLDGGWRVDGGYALWKAIGLELWLRALERDVSSGVSSDGAR